jgi:DNA-binding NarL/FixJ family response regulator
VVTATSGIRASHGLVLLADADVESRTEIVRILERAGYEVTAASSGDEALEMARDATPCIALLEVPLEGLSGYEVCRVLREEHGETIPIMFVSGSRTKPYDRVAGLLLGANDYIVKPCAPDELLTRVRKLIQLSRPLPSSFRERLTKREIEVLRLLANGHDPKDIAERLFISPKTVASHVENILRKLGVRSRTQAVALAYRDSILDTAGTPR